jgi:outer membrane protein TolC
MRVLGLLFFMSLTVVFPIGANALDSPEHLAALAVKANPEISMLRHQIEALEEQERAAAVWKDPVLMVEYSNMPWDDPFLGEHAMSGIQLKVQQTFPFPGKNDRRQAVAAAQVDVKRFELEELKSQLGRKVQQFYWKLVLVKRLKRIREKHITVVDRLLEAVKAKYASGRANQQDILKLHVLKEKLADDIYDFTQRRRELTATINSALHRDMNVSIETDEQIPLVQSTATLNQLTERAENERVLLKVWKKKAELERLAAEREGYEKWPDITVWTGYRIRREVGMDRGEDFVSIGMSVPIALDYKRRYEAKKGARLANALASEEKYKSVLDGISSGIERSLSKWQRSYQKAITYREQLIPGAEATLEAALSAWQVGRTEFSSLYQAELQLLNFEEAVVVARAQTVLMSLEVELLAGESSITEPERKS